MPTIPDKEIIHSASKAADITDALHKEIGGLECLDPFHDINPIMEQSQEHDTLRELWDSTRNQLSIACS